MEFNVLERPATAGLVHATDACGSVVPHQGFDRDAFIDFRPMHANTPADQSPPARIYPLQQSRDFFGDFGRKFPVTLVVGVNLIEPIVAISGIFCPCRLQHTSRIHHVKVG